MSATLPAPRPPPWGGLSQWQRLKTLTHTRGEIIFFCFSPFWLPSPKPNILRAHSSCHHTKCVPLDVTWIPELGEVGVCMGHDICDFQVKPALRLTCVHFRLLAFSGSSWGPHCFSTAVSTWLVATWLLHKVPARFKRVLGCTYNSGDAGCSEWTAVHIKYSEAESNVRELGHSTKTPNIDFSYKP